MSELRFQVGKAAVTVMATGCVDCGGELLSGSHDARHVFVQVGLSRQVEMTLYRCDDCQKKQRENHLEGYVG